VRRTKVDVAAVRPGEHFVAEKVQAAKYCAAELGIGP